MKKRTTLEDVINVISRWQKDNDVSFYGNFVSFDEDSNVIEDRMMCYGEKDVIDSMREPFDELYKREKDKFINW